MKFSAELSGTIAKLETRPPALNTTLGSVGAVPPAYATTEPAFVGLTALMVTATCVAVVRYRRWSARSQTRRPQWRQCARGSWAC